MYFFVPWDRFGGANIMPVVLSVFLKKCSEGESDMTRACAIRAVLALHCKGKECALFSP